MKMKPHARQLSRLGACAEAVAYANRYKTAQSAWDHCKREDWMFWLIRRSIPNNKHGIPDRRTKQYRKFRTATTGTPDEIREAYPNVKDIP